MMIKLFEDFSGNDHLEIIRSYFYNIIDEHGDEYYTCNKISNSYYEIVISFQYKENMVSKKDILKYLTYECEMSSKRSSILNDVIVSFNRMKYDDDISNSLIRSCDKSNIIIDIYMKDVNNLDFALIDDNNILILNSHKFGQFMKEKFQIDVSIVEIDFGNDDYNKYMNGGRRSTSYLIFKYKGVIKESTFIREMSKIKMMLIDGLANNGLISNDKSGIKLFDNFSFDHNDQLVSMIISDEVCDYIDEVMDL